MGQATRLVLGDVTQTLEASLSPARARWALGELSPTWTPLRLSIDAAVSSWCCSSAWLLALDAPFLPVPLSGSKVTLPLDDDSERLLLFAQ